ncbi:MULTISPECIES: antitoxin Xre/MbcA/ParS toxin-binding domain-containing protein [unclassified Pseudomonas]|uniref:antitoxin Xre/MbcA/ParS toxin-binding domain-containing protein n=1 Tax=unclassified Pseudomonas TaxID=196821 RepID=UPI000A1DD814|nr:MULTISPECIES: antitoxin Xre/MbcA/ParS toxin-binding domain-containing protein [unclassified Pseudomonas]
MDSKQNHGQDSTTPELIRRLAEQVFGNKAQADLWLNQPIAGRGDGSRLQAVQGKPGYELVKAELERLSHGFSC